MIKNWNVVEEKFTLVLPQPIKDYMFFNFKEFPLQNFFLLKDKAGEHFLFFYKNKEEVVEKLKQLQKDGYKILGRIRLKFEEQSPAPIIKTLKIYLGENLFKLIGPHPREKLLSKIAAFRDNLITTFGVKLPDCEFLLNTFLKPDEFYISYQNKPLKKGYIYENLILVTGDQVVLESKEGIVEEELLSNCFAKWISPQDFTWVKQSGCQVMEPSDILWSIIVEESKKLLPEFLIKEEIISRIENLKSNYSLLIEPDLFSSISWDKFYSLLRRILEEGLSIIDLYGILELINEFYKSDLTIEEVFSQVIVNLKKHLAYSMTGKGNTLSVMILEEKIEKQLTEALASCPWRKEDLLGTLVLEIKKGVFYFYQNKLTPILILTPKLKELLIGDLRKHFPYLIIFSHKELPLTIKLESIYTVDYQLDTKLNSLGFPQRIKQLLPSGFNSLLKFNSNQRVLVNFSLWQTPGDFLFVFDSLEVNFNSELTGGGKDIIKPSPPLEILKNTGNQLLAKGKIQFKGSNIKPSITPQLPEREIIIEAGEELFQLLTSNKGIPLLDYFVQASKANKLNWWLILPGVKVKNNLQLLPWQYRLKLRDTLFPVEEVTFENIHPPEEATVEQLKLQQREKCLKAFLFILAERLKENFSIYFGLRELSFLLYRITKPTLPSLKLSPRVLKYLKKLIQHLLNEVSTSINLPLLLLAVNNYLISHKEIREDELEDWVRQSMGFYICADVVNLEGEIRGFYIDETLEKELIKSAEITAEDVIVLMEVLEEAFLSLSEPVKVIFCSHKVRKILYQLTKRALPNLKIISIDEIPPLWQAISLGRIKLTEEGLIFEKQLELLPSTSNLQTSYFFQLILPCLSTEKLNFLLKLAEKGSLSTKFFYPYILQLIGRKEESLRIWEELLGKDPNNIFAYLSCASIYQEKGDWEEAIRCYREALQLDTGIAERLVMEGVYYQHLGTAEMLQIAKHKYLQAIILNPRYVEAHYNLGLVALETEEYSLAKEALEKAVKLDPENAFFLACQGINLYYQDELEKAEAFFEKALEMDSSIPWILFNYGLLSQKQGNLEKAEELFLKALKLFPDYVEVIDALGRVYWLQGKANLGRDYYDKAASLDPLLLATYKHLSYGVELEQANMLKEALSEYEQAVQFNTNLLEAYYYQGKIYSRLKDWPRAQLSWSNLLAMVPWFLEAHIGLEEAYRSMGEYQKAMKEIKFIEEKAFDFPALFLNKGLLYYYQGKIKEAIAEWNKHLEKRGDELAVRLYLGDAYFREGKLDEALEQYQKALHHSPLLPFLHSRLANIYFQQKKMAQAEEEFILLYKLEPQNAFHLINLAECMRYVKKEFASLIYLDKALNLAFDNLKIYDAFLKVVIKFRQLKEIIPKIAQKSNRGEIYCKAVYHYLEGNLEEAKKLFLKLKEILPYSASVYSYLGVIAKFEDKLEEAESYLNKALQCDPQDSFSLYNLGILYWKRGLKKEANSLFEQIKDMGLKESAKAFIYFEKGEKKKAILLAKNALEQCPYVYEPYYILKVTGALTKEQANLYQQFLGPLLVKKQNALSDSS